LQFYLKDFAVSSVCTRAHINYSFT